NRQKKQLDKQKPYIVCLRVIKNVCVPAQSGGLNWIETIGQLDPLSVCCVCDYLHNFLNLCRNNPKQSQNYPKTILKLSQNYPKQLQTAPKLSRTIPNYLKAILELSQIQQTMSSLIVVATTQIQHYQV